MERGSVSGPSTPALISQPAPITSSRLKALNAIAKDSNVTSSRRALVVDFALVVVYAGYAYFFHLGFDRLRPITPGIAPAAAPAMLRAAAPAGAAARLA